jgi:hypothetical protein
LALTVFLTVIFIVLAWLVLHWLLRPKISAAAITDQISAIVSPLYVELETVVSGEASANREAAHNEVVALVFVAACWGVHMGGGNDQATGDQCARLSVLYEQELAGFPNAGSRRLFMKGRHRDYTIAAGKVRVARGADKNVLMQQGAEVMVDLFATLCAPQRSGFAQRDEIVRSTAAAMFAVRDVWAKTLVLYRVRDR